MTADRGGEAMAGTQRITVGLDLVPGPLVEAVAERVLALVVEELRTSGIEITALRVELQGRIAAW